MALQVVQGVTLHRSHRLSRPRRRAREALCVWALAADDEAQARHHALSRDRWRVDRLRGAIGPLQSPDEIAAKGFTDEEMPTVAASRQKAFVGDPAQVGAKLRALAETFRLDELVINTWTHDPAARRRTASSR